MTDHELLLAISNMLDPIKEDISGMKGDIRELKGDVQGLKSDVQRLENRVKKIEMTQENEIIPRLSTIESCYISTYDRYRDSVEEHETMKQDLGIVKKVVAEHSEILQKIG